ncbi:MAG: dienelactone hydrolase family protein [Armatimonadota bacterium]|nr:dienelactone hydrolase family protein [Armatimonadota bacterium]
MIGFIAFAALSDDCCASMKEFTKDASFRAEHLAPEKIDFQPQTGKMGQVAIPGEPDANVFIVPPKEGSNAAVIMIHEWWGLNDHIKREAERLHAATGYGVLAVYMYDGRVATTSEQAGEFVRSVVDARAHAILRATLEAAKKGNVLSRSVSEVGTIGYCFGGGWSFQAALQNGTLVDACVLYYGMPETDATKLASLSAPVLGVFGKQDSRLGPELVGKFATAMATATKPLDIRVYDAAHAFANPSNPKYDKVSADKAWVETLAFYSRHLGN